MSNKSIERDTEKRLANLINQYGDAQIAYTEYLKKQYEAQRDESTISLANLSNGYRVGVTSGLNSAAQAFKDNHLRPDFIEYQNKEPSEHIPLNGGRQNSKYSQYVTALNTINEMVGKLNQQYDNFLKINSIVIPVLEGAGVEKKQIAQELDAVFITQDEANNIADGVYQKINESYLIVSEDYYTPGNIPEIADVSTYDDKKKLENLKKAFTDYQQKVNDFIENGEGNKDALSKEHKSAAGELDKLEQKIQEQSQQQNTLKQGLEAKLKNLNKVLADIDGFGKAVEDSVRDEQGKRNVSDTLQLLEQQKKQLVDKLGEHVTTLSNLELGDKAPESVKQLIKDLKKEIAEIQHQLNQALRVAVDKNKDFDARGLKSIISEAKAEKSKDIKNIRDALNIIKTYIEEKITKINANQRKLQQVLDDINVLKESDNYKAKNEAITEKAEQLEAESLSNAIKLMFSGGDDKVSESSDESSNVDPMIAIKENMSEIDDALKKQEPSEELKIHVEDLGVDSDSNNGSEHRVPTIEVISDVEELNLSQKIDPKSSIKKKNLPDNIEAQLQQKQPEKSSFFGRVFRYGVVGAFIFAAAGLALAGPGAAVIAFCVGFGIGVGVGGMMDDSQPAASKQTSVQKPTEDEPSIQVKENNEDTVSDNQLSEKASKVLKTFFTNEKVKGYLAKADLDGNAFLKSVVSHLLAAEGYFENSNSSMLYLLQAYINNDCSSLTFGMFKDCFVNVSNSEIAARLDALANPEQFIKDNFPGTTGVVFDSPSGGVIDNNSETGCRTENISEQENVTKPSDKPLHVVM